MRWICWLSLGLCDTCLLALPNTPEAQCALRLHVRSFLSTMPSALKITGWASTNTSKEGRELHADSVSINRPCLLCPCVAKKKNDSHLSSSLLNWLDVCGQSGNVTHQECLKRVKEQRTMRKAAWHKLTFGERIFNPPAARSCQTASCAPFCPVWLLLHSRATDHDATSPGLPYLGGIIAHAGTT